MLKACVQLVNRLRTRTCTVGDYLSPVCAMLVYVGYYALVQVAKLSTYTHTYTPLLSTSFFASLTASEHYLYPVSTAPIIRITRLKREER